MRSRLSRLQATSHEACYTARMPVFANRTVARLILIAAVVIAYGASLGNGFVFDDAMFVRDDPRVQRIGESPRLFVEPLWGYLDEGGVRHVHQYYRPLQTFPLAVSRAVFGERAWPAHLLNLLLHAANALLVWSILTVLLGSSGLALGLSLLWAVQPAYSEAVLWVSNLAGLGVALSILGLLRLHLASTADGWSGRLAMSALLLAGLLFHEIAVVAPLLLVAFELITRRPPRWRRLGLELVAFVPALLVYGSLRLRALGGVVPGLGTNPMSLGELVINGIALLPTYVATFLWPFDLNMYHDFDPVSASTAPAFIGGVSLLTVAAGIFVATFRRQPVAAFAIAWLVITTVPYLVIRWPQLNVFAERYLYLPSVGVFLLAGALLASGFEKGRVTRVVRFAFAGLVTALVVVSLLTIWRRTPDWRDDITLYTKTLTQSRRAVLIRNNLAVRFLEHGRYDDGIRILQEIAETPAATADTWHNLGLLHAGAGDDREALRAFARASRRGVPKWSTVLNLGYMYDRVGERRNAVETYVRLTERAPSYAPAWFNLAIIAFEAGQYDNARAATARVLQLTPEDPEALALQRRLQRLAARGQASLPAADKATERACRQAMRQARRGRFREAIILLRSAAWLDERAAVPHQYLANVAALRRDWPAALAATREALQRSPGNPLYRRNLAALEEKLAESKNR